MGNPDTLPTPAAGASSAPRRRGLLKVFDLEISFAVALALHLAALAILTSLAGAVARSAHKVPPPRQRLEITLDPRVTPSPEPPAPAQLTPLPPMKPLPPPPPLSHIARLNPLPVPKPPAPKVAPKPNPSPPAVAQAATPKAVESKVETPGRSLLERVRDNWLRPAHSNPSFRCKLQIDYRAGGFITRVSLREGCGSDLLDDSVQRAIWKTQPLPLATGATKDGSVLLEFTP